MNEYKAQTLFKYIGGKTWLREYLRTHVEKFLKENSSAQFEYYIEPFAGGLGAFLNLYDLLLKYGVKKIILNDINYQLISFYEIVQQHPEQLVSSYMQLENNFMLTIPTACLSLHKIKEKTRIKQLLSDANTYYKYIRQQYNSLKTRIALKHSEGNVAVFSEQLQLASYFLFLQNHSFNGVYRENSKGEHNTPFNWDAKNFSEEKIKEKILSVHKIFQDFSIVFSNLNYKKIDYSLHAIYYLDPPYINEDDCPENKYHQHVFDIEDQEKLIENIKTSSFIYSNHQSVQLNKMFDKYVKKEYTSQLIARKNIMSATADNRKNDKIEILIASL